MLQNYLKQRQEYVVDYNVVDLVPELLHFFGEPFADSSAIPTYHLSEVTQNVTVALSGDGGDEVFGVIAVTVLGF